MGTSGGADLRLYARFQVNNEAKISEEDGEGQVTCRLIDIGLGGVQLEAPTELKANSRAMLQVELEQISLLVTCRVLYCNAQNFGSYGCGLKFIPKDHQERVAIAEFVHDVFQRQWEVLAS
jgi:hypothetical protein